MTLPWYAIPVIFLFSLLLINILLVILFKLLGNPDTCCTEKAIDTDDEVEKATLAVKEENTTSESPNSKTGISLKGSLVVEERRGSLHSEISYGDSERSLSKKIGRQHHGKPLVTVVVDSTADSSLSGDEEEDGRPPLKRAITPISAYGDSVVNESQYRFVPTGSDGEYMRIHLSLIFSEERRYVAGKISQIEGVKHNETTVADQVKVHVVYLPLKKYILRTKYYKVNPLSNHCRIDEYFKMKFRKKLDIDNSTLRLRVYGKRVRAFSMKERCLGETKINFSEFASIRGGITLRRNVLPSS